MSIKTSDLDDNCSVTSSINLQYGTKKSRDSGKATSVLNLPDKEEDSTVINGTISVSIHSREAIENKSDLDFYYNFKKETLSYHVK